MIWNLSSDLVIWNFSTSSTKYTSTPNEREKKEDLVKNLIADNLCIPWTTRDEVLRDAITVERQQTSIWQFYNCSDKNHMCLHRAPNDHPCVPIARTLRALPLEIILLDDAPAQTNFMNTYGTKEEAGWMENRNLVSGVFVKTFSLHGMSEWDQTVLVFTNIGDHHVTVKSNHHYKIDKVYSHLHVTQQQDLTSRAAGHSLPPCIDPGQKMFVSRETEWNGD
ncbi:hypothetical protein C0J52_22133 [Blattella germanica]|nr:hypothetical protein C0J52_22133 [Blattella germanica]